MRPGRLARRPQGSLLEASDSLRAVDEDFLTTAERAIGTASEMWTLLGTAVDSARAQGVNPGVVASTEDGYTRALEATAKLKAALLAVRDGTSKELGRRPLFEVATAFARVSVFPSTWSQPVSDGML